MTTPDQPAADLHFWFDPVCPFAWMTRQVGPHGRRPARRLLRVAARARGLHGPDGVDRFYAACGTFVFERPPTRTPLPEFLDAGQVLPTVLGEAGLPVELADALDDSSYDALIQSETDEALSRTGKVVGTPILHFQPPHGVAFFGPVISRLPPLLPKSAARQVADGTFTWRNPRIIGTAAVTGLAGAHRRVRFRTSPRAARMPLRRAPRAPGASVTAPADPLAPRVLVLTAHDDDAAINTALRHGAHGYLLKSASADELVRGVLSVANGTGVYASTVVERITRHVSTGGRSATGAVFPQLTSASVKCSTSWPEAGATVTCRPLRAQPKISAQPRLSGTGESRRELADRGV